MTEKLTREVELKPCPFCGGTSIEIRPNNIGDYYVICDDSDPSIMACGASTSDRSCETEALAIRRWNRRDMASASLAPAGDGEVEKLMHDLCNLHRGYDAVVAAAIGRKAAYTLSHQQAEIDRLRKLRLLNPVREAAWQQDFDALQADLKAAERRATELQDELDQANATVASLRERLEKAEGELEVEQETSKAAHEDSVAEILRANAAVRRADAAEARVAELTRDVEEKDQHAIRVVAELLCRQKCRAQVCKDEGRCCVSYPGPGYGWFKGYMAQARQALTAAQGEGKQHATEREYDSPDQVARELVASGDPAFADLAPIIEEFDARNQGEEPAPVTTEELDKLQFGRVLHERPAPDHTAAIREAMGALEPFARQARRIGSHLNRPDVSDDELCGLLVFDGLHVRDWRRARAAHAKLTEIIGE